MLDERYPSTLRITPPTTKSPLTYAIAWVQHIPRSFRGPNIRSPISHPKTRLRRHSFSQSGKLFYSLVLKQTCSSSIFRLTGSSSREGFNRQGIPFFGEKSFNPLPHCRGMTSLGRQKKKKKTAIEKQNQSHHQRSLLPPGGIRLANTTNNTPLGVTKQKRIHHKSSTTKGTRRHRKMGNEIEVGQRPCARESGPAPWTERLCGPDTSCRTCKPRSVEP